MEWLLIVSLPLQQDLLRCVVRHGEMLLCVTEMIAARGDAPVCHDVATTAVHAARIKAEQFYVILSVAGVHIDAGAFFVVAR